MTGVDRPAWGTQDDCARALRSLPAIAPPAAIDQRIEAALDQVLGAQTPLPRAARRYALAATALLAVLAALAIGRFGAVDTSPDSATTDAGVGPAVAVVTREPVASTVDGLGALIARSAYLDSVWATLPQRGQVQRVGTASTITAIEDEVARIDARLSASAGSAGIDQRTQLWRERVALMNTLVATRTPPARALML